MNREHLYSGSLASAGLLEFSDGVHHLPIQQVQVFELERGSAIDDDPGAGTYDPVHILLAVKLIFYLKGAVVGVETKAPVRSMIEHE